MLPAFDEEPEMQPLLAGVEEVYFEYYDGETWRDSWDSTAEELPPLPDMSSTDGLEKLQGAINALRGRGEQMEMDLENQEIGGDAL